MVLAADTPVHGEDLQLVRDWFAALAGYVDRVDYVGSRHLVTEDFVAFGTFSNFLVGREEAENNQWRRVWQTTADFAIDPATVRALVSPDRLFAVGLAFFSSTGFHQDGSTFQRDGRATVSYTRKQIGDPWVATHSHMSLMRGTPDTSYGNRPPKS